jgi:D-alanine-D-alanine ligase
MKGKRVGVLLGGMSAERGVSLKSGHAVADALRSRGHDVVEIDVGPDVAEKLRAERVEVAWLALHGRFGEDGCIQGLCEILRIPYTGSGVRASAVAMDKVATKRTLAGLPGIVMAEGMTWTAGDPLPTLALPVIVKPVGGGSTIGTFKVSKPEEVRPALEAAAAVGGDVLVESFVTGDEITVPVIDGKALPVVRIVPESGFFDFEATYTKGKTNYEVPAAIAPETARLAQAAAELAHRTIGCRGLTRSDFMVRGDGTPVFLEINTLPGMTATSLSPMSAGTLGISFADLVEKILQGAGMMPIEVS